MARFDIGSSERNWHDDAALDNGQYLGVCRVCGKKFIGHKRRVECRQCAKAEETDDG